MAEFNFLRPKEEVPIEEKTQERKLLVGASLVLGVAIAVSIAVGLYNFLLQKRIQDLGNKKEQLNAAIASEQDKIALLARVHFKAKGIKYILDSQFNYSPAFRDFFQLLPGGVELKTVSIAKDAGLKADFRASSSAALKDFIAAVTNPALKYETILLGGISRIEQGAYSLSVNLKVPDTRKNGKK